MKRYKYVFHTPEKGFMEIAENTCNELKLYAAYLYE